MKARPLAQAAETDAGVAHADAVSPLPVTAAGVLDQAFRTVGYPASPATMRPTVRVFRGAIVTVASACLASPRTLAFQAFHAAKVAVAGSHASHVAKAAKVAKVAKATRGRATHP